MKANIELFVVDVFLVYSGKSGCMCGCRGKYYVARQHKLFADKKRGYDYEEKEISDMMVKRIYNLLVNNPDVCFDPDNKALYYDDNKRNYVAYFK